MTRKDLIMSDRAGEMMTLPTVQLRQIVEMQTHKTRQNQLSKQASHAKLNWKTHAARGEALSNSIRRAGYGHLLWPKKYIIPQKRGKTNRRTQQSPNCLMREGMCNESTRKCSRKVKHTSQHKSNKFERNPGTKYTRQTSRNDKWNENVRKTVQ